MALSCQRVSGLTWCRVTSILQRRFMGSFRRPGAEAGKSRAEYVPNKKKSFIDSLRIYARGGAGGQGLPKYGGIGGDGGNVVVVAKKHEALINVYKKYPTQRFVAGCGTNSTKFCLCGDRGRDVEIMVPPGVELLTDEGQVLGDLNEEGDRAVAALGGRGGNPENQFIGLRGDARSVRLNLKLIADVGLVGFPNAGKSTFLKAVSRAKPKIANYPFTTIRPQIGIMEFPDFRKISVADLPGLIEGAHANFGMGHKFLKHVERTKLLLFVVDINGFQLAQGYPTRSAFQTVLLLNKELELYRPDLLDKPAVLVVNKIDTDPEGHLLQDFMFNLEQLPDSLGTVENELQPDNLIKFEEVLTMSAKERTNTKHVMERLRTLLDVHADKQGLGTALTLCDDTQDELLQKAREHARKKLA